MFNRRVHSKLNNPSGERCISEKETVKLVCRVCALLSLVACNLCQYGDFASMCYGAVAKAIIPNIPHVICIL